MAGAGKPAEAALNRVVREDKGEYIVVVEGSIPTADDGVYCTIGGQNRSGYRPRSLYQCSSQHCRRRLRVGWRPGKSNPNPTGALGLHEAVPGLNVINLPAAHIMQQIPPQCWCTI